MTVAKSTAGQTRKTHKSVKTEGNPPLGAGPSSGAKTAEPPSFPANDLKAFLEDALAEAPETELTPADPAKKSREVGALDTGVPTEVPEKQWWYRPKDSKARKLVEKIVVMRGAGRDDTYIAKKLNTTPASVRQYMYVARKNGWLDADDEPVDLEVEMALTTDRKIVRNVNAALDGQMTNWQTHEMTIAAAKGRGHFKNHDTAKAAGDGAMHVVALQIIMPPVGAGDQRPEITESQMGGVPAYVEGEVEDGAEVLPELRAIEAGSGGVRPDAV